MKYLCIFLLFASSVFAQDAKTYIPSKAFIYRQIIHTEISEYFSNIPDYNYVPSLIEHESCISLKHRRCWEPTSQLKSARELGIGLGQITKAYNADGSIRFDSLSEMKNRYKEQLREASWDNLNQRPDIQIRMLVLMSRDNFKALYNIEDVNERLAMSDAAYNAGLGNVNKKRRACGIKANCDPKLWFNHTEKECIGHTRILYGTRSACDIVTHHVKDVLFVKIPKYQLQYFTKDNHAQKKS